MLTSRPLLKKLGISVLAICVLGSFAGEQSEENLRNALAPALTATGSSARLYFASQCEMDDDGFGHVQPRPDFPRLALAHTPTNATGFDAVREMLRNEPDALVSDQSGIIRIMIGDVPTALLKTNIARLTLKPIAQWNAVDAIETIEKVSEVAAAMRRLNLQNPPAYITDRIFTTPGNDRLPHLPPALENVTMDQALDAVARTFRELVIYGVCTQRNAQGVLSIYSTPLTECNGQMRGNPCFQPQAKMDMATPVYTQYLAGNEFALWVASLDSHGDGVLTIRYVNPGSPLIHTLAYDLSGLSSETGTVYVSKSGQPCPTVQVAFKYSNTILELRWNGSSQAFALAPNYESNYKELKKVASMQRDYRGKVMNLTPNFDDC